MSNDNSTLHKRIWIEVMGRPTYCTGTPLEFYTKFELKRSALYCCRCWFRGTPAEISTAHDHYGIQSFNPTTNLAEAWEVVEAMANRGYTLDLQYKGKGREYEFTAEASFTQHLLTAGHGYGTVGEAICRAALMAVEGEK